MTLRYFQDYPHVHCSIQHYAEVWQIPPEGCDLYSLFKGTAFSGFLKLFYKALLEFWYFSAVAFSRLAQFLSAVLCALVILTCSYEESVAPIT